MDDINQISETQSADTNASISGGVNITSEANTSVRGDVVGRDKIVSVTIQSDSVSNSAARKVAALLGGDSTAADEFVECPVCGKLNAPIETFRCKLCQRQYICLKHQDARFLVCEDCRMPIALQSPPLPRFDEQNVLSGYAKQIAGWATIKGTIIGTSEEFDESLFYGLPDGETIITATILIQNLGRSPARLLLQSDDGRRGSGRRGRRISLVLADGTTLHEMMLTVPRRDTYLLDRLDQWNHVTIYADFHFPSKVSEQEAETACEGIFLDILMTETRETIRININRTTT